MITSGSHAIAETNRIQRMFVVVDFHHQEDASYIIFPFGLLHDTEVLWHLDVMLKKVTLRI